MKSLFDFSILTQGPLKWCLLAFCGCVIYSVFKAWINSDGSVGYTKTTVKSDLPVDQVSKHFAKHHKSQGKSVDITNKKNGFDATTTDILGRDEHYEVRHKKQ